MGRKLTEQEQAAVDIKVAANKAMLDAEQANRDAAKARFGGNANVTVTTDASGHITYTVR